MDSDDLGGDPACWAHLVDDDGDVVAAEGVGGGALISDLGTERTGSGGAIWSLPHGGDLDANLVRLGPDGSIGEHVNGEVDVLIVVRTGTGAVAIDGMSSGLGPDHIALVPKGTSRSITAGPEGITYLSVHRRRGPMVIGNRHGSL